MSEALESQIDRLARFIMDEIPGEPSQSQGAVDTAIRLLRDCREKEALRGLVGYFDRGEGDPPYLKELLGRARAVLDRYSER